MEASKVLLQWRQNVHGGVSNNQPHRGEFPAQRASNAENISIWWRHHVIYDSPRGGIIAPKRFQHQSPFVRQFH